MALFFPVVVGVVVEGRNRIFLDRSLKRFKNSGD